MELSPDQVKQLKRLAAIVDKGNVGVFEYLSEVETKVTDMMAENKQMMADCMKQMRSEMPNMMKLAESLKGQDGKDSNVQGPKGNPGKDGYTPIKNKDYFDGINGKNGKDGLTPDTNAIIREVVSLIPTPKDGVNGKDGNIKELSPQEIRDSLELLQGEERLDAKYIKGLDPIKTPDGKFINGGIIGRNLVKDVDISASLDGITKTFNIPAVWNIISVSASGSPWVLRKNIDYTWTPTSITFTSEINADSTLAPGQTVVLTVIS
jgi:hypothetical protein